ncbi:MAG: helix-hairpin-helix domain-containing protein [Pirellula sp.]|jgi:competence ComEA-like helix-hairpin-helix protein|nr:helix-hairpin-helix domain-containing protein [Pirellula sp.]
MDTRSNVVENRAQTLAVLAFCLAAIVALRALYWQPIEAQEVVEIPPFSFDLNRATSEELDLIPGVGGKMAADIISLREEMGGFQSVEDLQNIRGIKKAKLAAISPYVFVENR